VLRQGAVLASTGVAIGFVMAAAGSHLLRSLLFGISALDPVTFAGAGILFGVVTLVASYLPARRATKVEPVAALRTE
jgi:ABC-type antimicrobial peptide transport system permease subunit